MKRFEGEFTTFDEENIFYQVWSQGSKPKGWMVITHGQGEHSECYHRLIEGVQELGYNVLAWDLRGHGRSSGARGYARDFQDYIQDFCWIYNKLAPSVTESDSPIWVSHSLGALIQLAGLLKVVGGPTQKQILSNPYLGLSMPIPFYKEIGAVILKNYLPKVTLGNEIENTALSRDPLVLKEYTQDILRHHKISAAVHLGAQVTQTEILARAAQFTGPLLMQISSNDPVVSSSRNKGFFEAAHNEPKKLEIYQDHKHELYNDIGREKVFHDIVKWVQALK